MKKIFMLLFLFSINLISQSYFNINYSNLEPTNSTPLGNMNKITFSETSITFHLNDNSTIDKNILFIQNCTFSDIDYGNPLPVELTSFNANINENSVLLTWQTATEVNNYGFEIERQTVAQISNLSSKWEKVGFVAGHGNSNSVKEYSFTDASTPLGASRVFYRLKQIDTDGSFEHSKEIEVAIDKPTAFSLAQNYPNPFNPTTTIKFGLPMDSKVVLEVYNIVGEKVTTLINNEIKSAGYHQVNFNANELATGIYIYRLTANDFTSTKKFVLMK